MKKYVRLHISIASLVIVLVALTPGTSSAAGPQPITPLNGAVYAPNSNITFVTTCLNNYDSLLSVLISRTSTVNQQGTLWWRDLITLGRPVESAPGATVCDWTPPSQTWAVPGIYYWQVSRVTCNESLGENWGCGPVRSLQIAVPPVPTPTPQLEPEDKYMLTVKRYSGTFYEEPDKNVLSRRQLYRFIKRGFKGYGKNYAALDTKTRFKAALYLKRKKRGKTRCYTIDKKRRKSCKKTSNRGVSTRYETKNTKTRFTYKPFGRPKSASRRLRKGKRIKKGNYVLVIQSYSKNLSRQTTSYPISVK